MPREIDKLGLPTEPPRYWKADAIHNGNCDIPPFAKHFREIEALLADTDRRKAVEAWKNAKAHFSPYSAGKAYDHLGNHLYDYPEGVNLTINGEDVMGSCEQPWSEAAIDLGVRELLKTRGGRGPFRVLELGFGQGFAARRAMRWLELYGGWYDAVELNTDVHRQAKRWEHDYNSARGRMWRKIPGFDPRPPIRIYHGDAVRAMVTRARKTTEGEEQPADLILMDTYPIMEKDKGQGTHDLAYLSIVKLCLKPDGIVVWYPWFEGSQGQATDSQRALIRPHFKSSGDITIPDEHEGFPPSSYLIKPPPHYQYLFRNGNPQQELPIGYFRNPHT